MAKNVVLNIKIDSKDGMRSLGVINKEGKAVLKTLGDMEQASEILNEKLRGVKVGTDKYKDLRAELVKVNKEIKNQELAMEALDNEQVAGELKSVAGGLADMAGGLVLIGASNQNIEKLVQTIAMVEGVTKAVTGAIELWSSGMKLLRNATKAQVAVQSVLNFVMSANPIGLIVLAIGALVAAFIAFREPIIEFISNWENLKLVLLSMLGPIGWIIIAYEKLFGEEAQEEDRRKQEAIARAKRHQQELKRISEERDAKIAAADETIKALELEKDTLEAEGKTSDAVTIKILEAELAKTQAVLDANSQKLQSWINYYMTEAELAGQSQEEFKKSMRARGVDLDLLQEKANELITENERNVQFAENKITKFKREQYEKRVAESKAAQEKEDAIRQKAYEDERRRLIELQNQRIAFLQELEEAENAYLDTKLSAQQREVNAVEDKYFRLIELAKQYNEDTAILEEARQAELKAIQDKYDALEAQKEKEKEEEEEAAYFEKIAKIQEKFDLYSGFLMQAMDLFNQVMDMQAEAAARSREYIYADETESLKAQLANREINQKEYDNKLRLLDQQKREAEKQAARKQFQRDKANNVVGAIMSTAQAVMQALASMPPPASFILAGVNAALGATQVGIIASQKFTAARGGLVPGMASKVDSVDALLAPGEAVINSNSTAAFAPLLSAINEAGGGVSFAPKLPAQGVGSFGRNEPVFRENKQEPYVIEARVYEGEMTRFQKRSKRYEDGAVF